MSDTYLADDHSLVYGNPKMFLLFLSLILSLVQTIFLDSYLGFFLPVSPRSSYLLNWNSVINFSQLVNLVFPFLIHNECLAIPEEYNHFSLPVAKIGNLRLYRFLLKCFYFVFILSPTY